MGIPRLPLSDLYGRAVRYIEDRGGEVHLRTAAEGFERNGDRWTVRTGADDFLSDDVILALSSEGFAKLLPSLPKTAESEKLSRQMEQFQHSPITSVHLWFDREITELTHAALLDTTIQWLYNKSKVYGGSNGRGYAIELVISASKSLVSMQRQEIVDLAMRELAGFFPAVKQAKLLKAAVTKEAFATYSIRPGLDQVRPSAKGPWPGIYLAGDWTATGWPATMESGVRSGYLAAEAIARDSGESRKFVAPDLPPTGLMRMFS